MATSTMTPTTETNAVTTDIKISNETYRVYVTLDPTGKFIQKTEIGTGGKDGKWFEKQDAAASESNGLLVLGLEQTLRVPTAGTWEGASQLITDEEERVNIFNRGLKQKLQQKVAAYLGEETDDHTSLKFDPVSGAFDVTDWLNEETKRRNLTDAEKAFNSLKKAIALNFAHLPEADREAKLQQMLAFMQQS